MVGSSLNCSCLLLGATLLDAELCFLRMLRDDELLLYAYVGFWPVEKPRAFICVLRTVGLMGDVGGRGERSGALREREGRVEAAAWVEMLRESLGFMAREEASMMAVVGLGCWSVGSTDVVLGQLGPLINKEGSEEQLCVVYKTIARLDLLTGIRIAQLW
jgi:hypothetical protein